MELKTFSTSEKNLRRLQGSLKLFGITQRELARKIGCHESYVSNIFASREKADLKLKAIVKILQKRNSILNYPMGDFKNATKI